MPTRRDLLVGAPALGVAVLGAASLANSAIAFAADTKPADTKTSEAKAAAAPTGPFTLAALPFADTDLVPYISQNTLSFHYGKHHAKYVSKLNELYAKHTGKAAEQIEKDMDRDMFMSSEEALVYGIIDKVIQQKDGAKTGPASGPTAADGKRLA